MLFSLLLSCAPKVPLEAVSASSGSCPRPDGMFGPVVLPKDVWEARIGASTQHFSELVTTAAQPVEVCGVQEQVAWLTRVQCEDGSNPFHSLSEAHNSRAGNVGSGGRCGSIIDLYQVPCPEKTYPVYMDLYVCSQR